jgi:2-methylisocitrate lyase-like PEP mutase family enzyme
VRVAWDMTELTDQADTLRRLHHGAAPLLLPNAWDVASARAVAETGFPVVATSSHAVAASLGVPDADTMAPDVAFGVIARIAAAVDVPVTADIEGGYQLPAPELVDRLLSVGAVGCNLEDTDHHGHDVLVPVDDQAQRLRSLRRASDEAAVAVVINARIDVFLREVGSPESQLSHAIQRAQAYLTAGADCVFPIGLTDPDGIARFVREAGGSVNIWLRPDGPSRQALTDLGVARISLAGGLFRRSLAAVERTLAELQT